MKYRITPHFIDLTYDALLKSFWRKTALKKFLRQCSISESHLQTFNESETKRAFLDRTFQLLQNNEKGKQVIFKIATFLSEQTKFPDLESWEDRDQKIKDAVKSVNDLKVFLIKQSKEIRSEDEKNEIRQQAIKNREAIQRDKTDKIKLNERFNLIAQEVGTQSGGYAFQVWFYDLLDYCEIVNKRPYVIDGRQIDGSFTLEGTTYLVELKFTASQSDATDIDSFKSKIDKMADNTMGVFLSISGYSSVALNEASGKKMTILLIDYSHLMLYLTGIIEFQDVILRLRRHASQTGQSYLSANELSLI